MTRHIPPELESAVAERGTLTNKLLVALIEAVNEQNAIRNDTIHDDLMDISRQLEGMSINLSAIAGNTSNPRW